MDGPKPLRGKPPEGGAEELLEMSFPVWFFQRTVSNAKPDSTPNPDEGTL